MTKESPSQAPNDPVTESSVVVLPHRTLVRAARHRSASDTTGCEVLLGLIIAERHVRSMLHKIMENYDLSEYRFVTLLSLFALDPMMPTAADLAYHSNVSRSAMTDILDQLEAKRWVVRHRHAEDRRVIQIEITEAGRQITSDAIGAFLDASEIITRDLPCPSRSAVLSACGLVSKQALRASGEENVSQSDQRH